MPWVILSDTLPDDPRVLRAGYESLGILVAAVAYANRHLTDGYIPDEGWRRIGVSAAKTRRLIEHGLLHRAQDGYVLAQDVASWQPTRERVERERKQKAERQARWRAGKGRPVDASTGADVDASPDASGDASRPTPPRPAPKGRGAGLRPTPHPEPPRCEHGRRLAADGAGCALCDQIPAALEVG